MKVCYDETNDAIAAYTHALLWCYTGNRAHAQKSISILISWSATLIDHKFSSFYSNGHLQAAWAGEVFPSAAEIIRYTFTPKSGESALDVASASLLPYWRNPSTMVNGLQAETCRDMNHTAMGVGPMINVAETARIQGKDLYGEQRARIVAAMEVSSGYLNGAVTDGRKPPTGWPRSTPINATASRLEADMGAPHRGEQPLRQLRSPVSCSDITVVCVRTVGVCTEGNLKVLGGGPPPERVKFHPGCPYIGDAV